MRNETTAWSLIFVAWLIASVSTLGALFFGEVMQLPPCVLCWYQRIFMFPLVLILPLGLFPLDPKVVRYALPLAVFGWLFAVFHLLLVAGVFRERQAIAQLRLRTVEEAGRRRAERGATALGGQQSIPNFSTGAFLPTPIHVP